MVSPELIAIFNEQELELLISGLPDIDVDDWKNNTEYHNYSASSSQIQWFWRAVRSFDKEVRAKLLQFVTGTSKVPLNGFSQLEGMNGFSRFNIHRDYGNKDRLPSSHTCFNRTSFLSQVSGNHTNVWSRTRSPRIRQLRTTPPTSLHRRDGRQRILWLCINNTHTLSLLNIAAFVFPSSLRGA